MTVPYRTKRWHLWAIDGTRVVHVVKCRARLHDRANDVIAVSNNERMKFPRRDLYSNRDEAEREVALRVLAR